MIHDSKTSYYFNETKITVSTTFLILHNFHTNQIGQIDSIPWIAYFYKIYQSNLELIGSRPKED